MPPFLPLVLSAMLALPLNSLCILDLYLNPDIRCALTLIPDAGPDNNRLRGERGSADGPRVPRGPRQDGRDRRDLRRDRPHAPPRHRRAVRHRRGLQHGQPLPAQLPLRLHRGHLQPQQHPRRGQDVHRHPLRRPRQQPRRDPRSDQHQTGLLLQLQVSKNRP